MFSRRSKKNIQTFSELKDWYRSPLGESLGRQEADTLRGVLPTLFGYHLVVVAPPWQSLDLDASRIGHRVVCYPHDAPGTPACGMLAGPEALPVVTDSLDAVVLPHTLEFAQDPHQVLREVDRCLIPEGHLVLFGFNPLGTWGLWRAGARLRGRSPWTGRFYSLHRVKDWLSLLGFETRETQALFHRLPVSGRGIAHRHPRLTRLLSRGGYPLAAAYMLVARKRELAMRPLRSRWRPRPLLDPGLVKPTTRNGMGRGRAG